MVIFRTIIAPFTELWRVLDKIGLPGRAMGGWVSVVALYGR